jgi:hypothetical protein
MGVSTLGFLDAKTSDIDAARKDVARRIRQKCTR